jgi:uncharacterized Zn-binding protein involved in type VI secretion
MRTIKRKWNREADMKRLLFVPIALAMLALVSASVSARAQSPSTPGVVTGGSNNVSIGGKNAARQGDTTSDGNVIVEGSPNVFINGKPAAVSSGKTGCGGVVVGGAGGVYINGKPAARTGDHTSGCAN